MPITSDVSRVPIFESLSGLTKPTKFGAAVPTNAEVGVKFDAFLDMWDQMKSTPMASLFAAMLAEAGLITLVASTTALSAMAEGDCIMVENPSGVFNIQQKVSGALQPYQLTVGNNAFQDKAILSSVVSSDYILVLDVNKTIKGLAAPSVLQGTPIYASNAAFVVPEFTQNDTTDATAEANTTILQNFIDKQAAANGQTYDGRAILIPPGKGISIKPGRQIYSWTNIKGMGKFQSVFYPKIVSGGSAAHVFSNLPSTDFEAAGANSSTDIVGFILENFGIIGWDSQTSQARQAAGAGISIQNTTNDMSAKWPELQGSYVDTGGIIRDVMCGFLPSDGIQVKGRGHNLITGNFTIRTRGRGGYFTGGFDSEVSHNVFSDTGIHGCEFGWTASRLLFNKSFYNGKYVPGTVDGSARWYGFKYGTGVSRVTDVGNEAQDCAGGGWFITGWDHQISNGIADLVGADWREARTLGPDYVAAGVKTAYFFFYDCAFIDCCLRGMNFKQENASATWKTDHYVMLDYQVQASTKIDVNISEKRAPNWNGPYAKRVTGAEVAGYNGGENSNARVAINGRAFWDGLAVCSLAELGDLDGDANLYRKDPTSIRQVSDNSRYVIAAGGDRGSVWKYLDDGTTAATPA